MNKKIVIILVLSLFFISSCVLNTEKTIDKLYENPVIDDNKDNNGENNQNTEPSNKFLDNHKLNPNNFDGHGMEYRILMAGTGIDNEFERYPYKDKEWRLKIIEEVEKAYNIKVKFVTDYDVCYDVAGFGSGYFGCAAYDPTMLYISSEAGNDISDLDNAFYAFYGYNSEYFMTTLNQGEISLADILYPLEMPDGTGLFSEKGYSQNNISSSLTIKNGIQYGFSPMYCDYNNSYLFYDIEDIKALGLTDPDELWLRGEWNLSSFTSYIKAIDEEIDRGIKISNDCYVLSYDGKSNFTTLYLGLKASLGIPVTDSKNKVFNVEDNFGVYETILSSLSSVDYSKSLDACSNFVENSVFICSDNADTWGMNYEDSFIWTPSDSLYSTYSEKRNYNIVPFPLDDTEKPLIKTSTNIEDALYNIYGEPIMDGDGNYIVGVDIDETKYQYSISKNNTSFMIPNFKVGENGITPEISFDILYDLFANYDEEEIIESKRIELDDLVIYDRFDKTSLAVINSVNGESKAYIEMAYMLSDCGYGNLISGTNNISVPSFKDMFLLDLYLRQDNYDIDQKIKDEGVRLKEQYQNYYGESSEGHTYCYLAIEVYKATLFQDGRYRDTAIDCLKSYCVFPWYWLD